MSRHIPTPRHGSGLLTMPAFTFDGVPFNIEMAALEEIDHGASAKIYKGYIQGKERQVVAVKVFGQMLGKVQEQLLVRELRAARKVSKRHRYILPFIGSAFIGQHQAIVSLYMQNGNLSDYLKTHPCADRKRLILQVAKAVRYLHEVARLVHGDLKCANVLISDDNNALLADFGLSTFIENNGTRTISAIRSMSTVAFAAPELLLGPADQSAPTLSKSRESDVYAFGMLILEAVTGQVPFVGLGNYAIMYLVCSGRQPSRPIVNGFVNTSHSWWNLCRCCWAFNPVDRPSMNTIVRTLTKHNLLPHRELYRSEVRIESIAYMPCGKRAVSCSRAIEIRDIPTGKLISRPSNTLPPLHWTGAMSPKTTQIACSDVLHAVLHVDVLSGKPCGRRMEGHTDKVTCIAYSPDGNRIASGSRDRTIRLWDASTGEAIGNPFRGPADVVRSLAFSPDGNQIISTSYDQDPTIRIWDISSGKELAKLTGHSASRGDTSVRYLPNGRFIVCGSFDNIVRMWSTETLQLVYTMRGHSSPVLTVAVSPSGKYIASGSLDRTIRIWDAETGESVGGPLIGHASMVYAVAFSPNGKSLLSSDLDNTVRIWELFD